ncbi:enoyl-CoA hydratase/isomerase family protein [Thalassotalea sp. Y01]|uniref:enoyl-CoA hydratase/isomerase family protein n=1 Tax=Thalassotalea sp. Y01 TaxID=2729613 RepID=UPI00145D2BA9|nr:enoyl-CoA hydratase/isomerase family protein [Thalassotalea sp. Y01]NMP17748.1 enoyl-CoA hydratase/isomerase family protein [Thalassotalea sp. Y01]
MSDIVLFDELECRNDKKLALITLNSEKSLNALSHAMVNEIKPKLKAWQERDDIVAVFLQGAGDKAFCAGGDIVYLYNNLPDVNGDPAPKIEQFFLDEYELDHMIHTYNKPFIVWGNGIVMGGGLGLMAGASHRVATENTRIAMPEISIGLYPDVGGSYFLNKMPNNTGLFLGLTGAAINATDAKYVSLADHFIAHTHKQDVLNALAEVNWGGTKALNEDKLSDVLLAFEQQSKTMAPVSNIKGHQLLIDELTAADNISQIVANIKNADIEDKWFNRAQKSLAHGSALSVQLTYNQIQKSKNMSLAECFRMELTISKKCGEFGEFKEGVRALLIEKDNNPQWKYPDVASVEQDVIDWFFTSDYIESAHPLGHL